MKYAIITVDTEAPAGSNPIETLIKGKLSDGKMYGIEKLMEMFAKHDYTGLFFVDMAEAWDNGKDKIADVIRIIKNEGHDVGVHIHPDHMADPLRRFLWEYTYEEQFKIIQQCTDFYMDVVGVKPISFRAGRYGANDDTIKILDKLGYKYDFSEFPHNKRCRMTFDMTYNQVKKIPHTNLKEIPVSVFKSFNTPFYSRFDKIDVAQSLSEYKKVLRQFNDNQMIVFFAHSFSLLDWRRNPDNPKFNKNTSNKIENMLMALNENNIRVISEESITEVPSCNNDGFISMASGFQQYVYFAKRAYITIKERCIRNI